MSQNDNIQTPSENAHQLKYESGSGETNIPRPAKLSSPRDFSDRDSIVGGIRLPQELKLLQQIGHGGMGTVYLVERDTGFRTERLALKTILSEHLENPSAIERFEKEIDTLLRLRHDHIVALRDFRFFEGYYFFLMEYLEGMTLQDDIINRGPMDLARMNRVFSPLALAVDYAHGKGVIHRDIKPMNIMLSNLDMGHLLDFGIARIEDREKTQTRRMGPGTWEYMAPEQFDDESATCSVDVYGFGATLFYALTGRHPFETTGIRKLLLLKDQGCPSLDGSQLPESMQTALRLALSPDPGSRPNSCVELIELMNGRKKSVAQDLGGESSTKLECRQTQFVEHEVIPESMKTKGTIPNLITNKLGMKFRFIPAGRFSMGSPLGETGRNRDETQHEVLVTAPFYMGIHTVTRGDFEAFVSQSGYRTEAELDGNGAYYWTGKDWKQAPDRNWRNPGFPQSSRDPVVCISWNDAIVYCGWVSQLLSSEYRLPTEAEWEYACRAGSTTAYHFGKDVTELSEYAWYKNNSGLKTNAVGQKKPNCWGLFDMHGNVWEWCSDWYGEYPGSAVTNPTGSSNGLNRVIRGDSWLIEAMYCRSADRFKDNPSTRVSDLGFRLALSVSAVSAQ
jgi:eukaryotic-like serine/threonine-protein kinase